MPDPLPDPRPDETDLEREFRRLRGALSEHPELRFVVEGIPDETPEPSPLPTIQQGAPESDEPENVAAAGHEHGKLATAPAPGTDLLTVDDYTELNPNRITKERKRQALRARQEMFQNAARELNQRLKRGRIESDEWLRRMMGEVKDLHTTALAIGESGRWDNISQEEWGQLGANVQKQYRFLRRWRRQIDQQGVEEFSLAQLNDRAQKYGSAASESYQIGYTGEVGVPIGELPAMPGDGTTECMTRCKCRWAINTLDKERGDFDCTWTLGVAEHCETCLERSVEWVQLEIRGGILVSDFKRIFAR